MPSRSLLSQGLSSPPSAPWFDASRAAGAPLRWYARAAAGVAIALLALGCGSGDSDGEPEMASAPLSPEEEQNIGIATRVIEEGLVQGNVEVIEQLVRPDYIQHNATASDGRDWLLQFVAAVQAQGGAAVTIHRKLASGDLVALHSTYGTGDARRVAFDVFRVEGGQLAEHWDAMQEWAEPQATVSGNTLVDGPTEVTSRGLTEENETLVTRMVREVFVEGRYDRLPAYIGDPYIQHNPAIDDGLQGMQAFLSAVQAQGVALGYTASPLVVADGNFVLVGSEGYLNTRDDYTVFYDLYRVDDGKLVEHWDVIQAIDLDAVPHSNGLF
jgi:predicted SnoaL-like aldol condensation-catalyzing enzyme